MDSDWDAQNEITEGVKLDQQMRVKDNVIKDLKISHLFATKQIDALLAENWSLRQELEHARASSVTYIPKTTGDTVVSDPSSPFSDPAFLLKLQELRNAGEQLQQDIAKLRAVLRRD